MSDHAPTVPAVRPGRWSIPGGSHSAASAAFQNDIPARRRGRLPGLVALLGLAAIAPCQAQNGAPRFGHLTVEHGLSNAWVQGIVKDSRGFLWFGTQEGLNRYAGGSFSVYRYDPNDVRSLPISSVKVIFEDSRKHLWLGGNWGRGGLARYDFEQDRFLSFVPDGSSKRPDIRAVRAITEDRQGRIWIATDNGLFAHDQEKETFTAYRQQVHAENGLSSNSVHSVIEDRRGRLWIGTNAGLDCLDTRSGRVSHWPVQPNDPRDVSRFEVWALHEDDAGTLWVGTLGGGLHHLDPATGRETRYLPDTRGGNSISTDRVRALAGDGQGRLFIGTENGGLDVLDTRTGRFTHYATDLDDPASLSSMSIYSLLFDDQGILWIGTFNGGVNVLSPLGQRFGLIRAGHRGLSDPHVTAVVEDHLGDLWVGTDGGGLNRLERKTGRITAYRHDPRDPTSIGSDAILALYEDEQHRLWVGGWYAGLARFDRASGRFVRFRHPGGDDVAARKDCISWIHRLSSGELALATWEGVELFDRRTGTFRPVSDRYPGAGVGSAFSVAEDGNGGLWLAGDGRVEHVDERSGKRTVYRHDSGDPQSLGSGRTWTLYADSRDNVWVGTENGLNVFEAGTRRLRRIGVEDGLPNDAVGGILEDESGSLWLSTNQGLAKFIDAVRLPSEPRFLSFDVHDGLQGTEFRYGAAYRARSGEMFFGGHRGLTHFFPAEIRTNPDAPRVVITDLRILNRPVTVGAPGSPLSRHISLTKEITLSHRQNVVTLDFAALNFLVPEKNQYAYRLEGLEPDWNTVGTQHSATYTGLPPGSYVFRVRASNNDGVWNDAGASLHIRVRPPFWMTLWFRLLLVSTLAAAVFVAYRRHLQRLETRRKELEGLVTARTGELLGEVAERRRAEQEVRRLNEGLEERVAQRTEQLQAETERLAVTLRSIGDGVIATDTEGRVVLMNRVAERTTGWPSSEALDKPLADILRLVDRDTRVPVPDPARAVLSGGKGTLEIRSALLRTRDGRELLVSDSAAPIRDPESRVVGVVLVFRDISEKQRIEEQLQNAARLESLGLLAGGIAHDFNNLLAGIFGHIELARRRVTGDQLVAQRLHAALEVMERARGLTQQLLTFTTAGQPVTAPVALDALVKDAARFALAGSNVDCVFELPSDLWPCQADGRQIGQVVDNLLINARHAMPAGGTVRIAACNVTIREGDPLGLPPGRHLKLVVSDRGQGIPRELQAKVFDPFFTTKPTGTGLGLSVSYSIIKRHGGQIALESTPGVGTTVTLFLPAAVEGAVVEAERTVTGPRGRGRVLVMDDEADLREIARDALQDLGYEVATARNGSEAVALCEHAAAAGRPFDVALLDLTIPGHNGGAEVLAQLRKLVPDIAAIASSGYSSDPIMAHPQASGFAAALAKPYRIGELGEAVGAALAAGRSHTIARDGDDPR
jgi:PAS domain S-box-containing protein